MGAPCRKGDSSMSDLVFGWKEIASALDIAPAAARRFARAYRAPVHRVPGRRGRVWASRAVLGEWLASVVKTAQPR